MNSLHVLSRNRTRHGKQTYDIMEGPEGRPEQWDMVAEKIEGKDRADLFAAAPDLLEACKLVLLAHESAGAHSTIDPGQAVRIRAAIAKAEGREGE
jgi:hypothetical protein